MIVLAPATPSAARAAGSTAAARRPEGRQADFFPTVVEELKVAGLEIVQVVPDWPGKLFLVLARKPR